MSDASLSLEVKSDGVATASQRMVDLARDGAAAEVVTTKFTDSVIGLNKAHSDTSRAISDHTDKVTGFSGASGDATRSVSNLSSSVADLSGYLKVAAEAFAAWKVAEFVKDVALLAARYETLGVVMKVIGNNAGYTGDQMAAFQVGLQKTGISAIEARQGLALMGQAQVDMAKSSQLARVAQDAAVIANTNSSDAFNRMITGISTGQAIILHHMGLMVNFMGAERDLAATLGKTKDELTNVELTTARVNEVMRVSIGISGSYEAAMDTTGKALTSMKRFADDAKVALGAAFGPALTVLVSELTRALKDAGETLKNNKGGVKSFGDDLGTLTSGTLNYFKTDLITINALLLDMRSGLYLLGAVAAAPGMIAGTGLVKELLAKSKGYADQATADREGLAAMQAAAAVKGPVLDPSEQGRANTGKDAAENLRIAAGNKLREEAAAESRKAAAAKAAEEAAALAEKQAVYDKRVLDSEAALQKQARDNAKRAEDAALKDRLSQLTYEKDQGLKTVQEYLDAKYALERVAWQKELDDANAMSHEGYGNYVAVSNKPGADVAMQNDEWKKYIDLVEAAVKIKQKMDAATAQQPRDDAKNGEAIQRYSDEMAIQQLKAEGEALAATYAANEVKYADLKKKGYTEEAIGLAKVNDLIAAQVVLYNQQVAAQKATEALKTTNAATAASMVGTNAIGGFDSVADHTANQLAVQQQAHEARLKMIDDERSALAASVLSSGGDYAAFAARKTQLDAQAALEVQKNSKATGAIAVGDYKNTLNAAANYTGMAGQMFTLLASTQDQSSRSGFESAKSYNIAAAIMSTAAAVMNAFATMPWPAAPIAAGLAAATGAIQIAKISSTTFGSGGSVAAPGSFSGQNGSNGTPSGQGYVTGAANASSGGAGSSVSNGIADAQNAMLAAQLVASGKNTAALNKVTTVLTSSATSGSLANGAPGQYTPLTADKSPWMAELTGGLSNIKDKPYPNLTNMLAMSGVQQFFGLGNKWQTTGAGMSLGVNKGNLAGSDFVDSTKKGGWFTSDSHSTSNSALDAGVATWLTTQINSIKLNTTAAAAVLGTTTTDQSKVGITNTKIATAGRSTADIQKDVDVWVASVNDAFAKTIVGLDAFTHSGETAGAAYMRLASAAQGVAAMFTLTGNQLLAVSLQGAQAASNLVDAYGGLDKLQAANQTFVDAVYDPTAAAAYKAAAAAQQVNDTFATLGLAVPTTNTELIKLRDGLDMSTTSGQATWVALTNVGTAFHDMTAAATKAATTLQTVFLDTSLTAANMLKTLMGGNLSTLTPQQQLMQQQAAFAQALATGNTKALPAIGQSLLTASQNMYGSGAEYQTDYKNVTTALGAQAGINGSLTLSSIDNQILAITSVQTAISSGTMATVNSIAELKAEIVALGKQLQGNSDATIAATIASGGSVADALIGSIAAALRH